MTIQTGSNSLIVSGGETLSLSQMFSAILGSSRPAYLVLTALDRNEYTAAATGKTGSFSGDGNTAQFGADGGDGRAVSIVFTYDANTGLYYNGTYGFLNQLQYTTSGSLSDVTNISLFGTNDPFVASYAWDAYSMVQEDASGYLGSVTVATEPGFAGSATSRATPSSIAAVAASFIGHAWNMDGCWVLASTIAAEAGASLPVQSTMLGLPGQANGEWIVAYDGPAGQSANWQSMVKAGEMVVFINAGGASGHITTCVSGLGATAMLVDNITYESYSGQVLNAARDGSSNDIVIASPHLASQEFAGVAANSVVIYELDTPIVSDTVARDNLAARTRQSLAALFAANDPASRAIVEYQVFDTWAGDSLAIGGNAIAAHSVTTAASAASLTLVSLVAGNASGSDTLEVRAFNGSYWGDWTALSVTVAPAAPVAPTVTNHTPNQTWQQGRSVSLALAANTFTDPEGQALIYKATLANGQVLPGWLNFNSTTHSFSGTVPAGVENFSVSVTATDTSGLSATETFGVSVPAAPPILARQTAEQYWSEGKSTSFALPASTFIDPQEETLTYKATLANGQALPAWLTFNAVSESFSGTAPITPSTLAIQVTATNSSGLASSDVFLASIAPAPVLANQTPNLVWNDGAVVNFALPPNTFTDASGQRLHFATYEVSGPNLANWLSFNGNTAAFSGNVPRTMSGTVGLEVYAFDNNGRSASETFAVTFGKASSSAISTALGHIATELIALHA